MPTNETTTPAYRWQLIADACKAIKCNLSALDKAMELEAAGVADAMAAAFAWAVTKRLGAIAQGRVAFVWNTLLGEIPFLCEMVADAVSERRN